MSHTSHVVVEPGPSLLGGLVSPLGDTRALRRASRSQCHTRRAGAGASYPTGVGRPQRGPAPLPFPPPLCHFRLRLRLDASGPAASPNPSGTGGGPPLAAAPFVVPLYSNVPASEFVSPAYDTDVRLSAEAGMSASLSPLRQGLLYPIASEAACASLSSRLSAVGLDAPPPLHELLTRARRDSSCVWCSNYTIYPAQPA